MSCRRTLMPKLPAGLVSDFVLCFRDLLCYVPDRDAWIVWDVTEAEKDQWVLGTADGVLERAFAFCFFEGMPVEEKDRVPEEVLRRAAPRLSITTEETERLLRKKREQ